MIGGNFESSHTRENQILTFDDASDHNPTTFFIGHSGVTNVQTLTNYAVFGNGEYDVLPVLSVHGGARYTNSKDTAHICGYSPFANNGNIPLFELLGELEGGKLVNLGPASCYTLNNEGLPGQLFTSTLHQSNVSFRAGVDYKQIENTLLYFNISRGFKAGSYPSLAAGTFAQLQPVVQEQLQAYEVGFKTRILNKKLILNGALFYYDYSNKQVRGKLEDPVFGPLDALVNVPKSDVEGAELDATTSPVAGLLLNASVTYLQTDVERYSGYDVLGHFRDFAGSSLPDTPKWSVG